MNRAPSILIVEDEIKLAELVRDYLAGEGFAASIETDGLHAVRRIVNEQPDVVLLDLMLPGLDGLGICRQVRAAYHGPIVIVTASQADYDQITGLELGADDYVVKPVVPRVLLARIRAVLRRASSESDDTKSQIIFGELVLDQEAHALTWRGQDVGLTGAEFALLWVLAQHRGEIMSRDRLVSHLRGIGYDGFDRSVDLRLSRLRAKIAVYPDLPFAVRTVHSKGYVFAVKE
jgi:two-component system, OmpR family, response regulator RstA